jgi:hypothetical protein
LKTRALFAVAQRRVEYDDAVSLGRIHGSSFFSAAPIRGGLDKKIPIPPAGWVPLPLIESSRSDGQEPTPAPGKREVQKKVLKQGRLDKHRR